jgi:acetylornithine deacetylase
MVKTNTQNKLDSAISILGDLVAFSILGGQSNLPIAKCILKWLQKNDVDHHEVFNESKDKVSIHCRIGPEVDGGIILSGHMDVVTSEGQQWSKPDFTLTKEDNKLYARGTSDMKGFLACCLAMLPHFKQANLKKPIYFAFSYDEEIGCLASEQLILSIKSTYKERPSFAIIGEPSLMQTVNGEKGAAFFRTTIYSAAAHSSEVRKSISAIEESTYLIQWLLGKMDEFIKEQNFDDRFEPPYTTIHVGVIKGGNAVNIIADQCEFTWDVRNIPSDSIEEILCSFEEFCAKRTVEKQETVPDFKIITSKQFSIVPGLDTSENSEIIRMVNAFSGTDSTKTVSFASEAGYFSEAGFETVVCGPGSMDQGHRADEFIEINELKKCLSFLERMSIWAETSKEPNMDYEKI